MKLELDELDLQKEHRDRPTSTIKFEHLTEAAQAAVIAVGRGTFYRDRGSSHENYNAVFPPK